MKKTFLIVFIIIFFAFTCLSACKNNNENNNSYDINKDNDNDKVVIDEIDIEEEKNPFILAGEYSNVFAASAVNTEIGEYVAASKTIVSDGSVSGDVASVVSEELLRGYYRLTVEMKLEKSSSASLSSVAQIYLKNSNTGMQYAVDYIIGRDATDDFESYVVNFVANDNLANYDIELYSTGLVAIEFKSFNLISTSPEVADNENINILFSPLNEVAEFENSLTYDPQVLYFVDLREMVGRSSNYTHQYDMMTIVTALQGLVNRNGIHLYVRYVYNSPTSIQDTDMYWLEYFEKKDFIQQESIIEITGINTLLRIFSDFYTGLVIWDQTVPSTYNVAITDAGVNDRIPVRFSSSVNDIYYYMTQTLGIEVKLKLYGKFDGTGNVYKTQIPSTQSAKCDAYIYATEKYIKGDLSNPYVMCSYVDAWIGPNGDASDIQWNITGHPARDIVNRDYIIAKKGFAWDLSSYDKILPSDDLNQPLGTDYNTLNYILEANAQRDLNDHVVVFGFTNWDIKVGYDLNNKEDIYTDEEKLCKILGNYGGGIVADAPGMTEIANASVFMHYNPEPLSQSENTDALKEKANETTLENKNYICIYVGDFDNSSWLYRYMPSYMSDPHLGDVPVMWPTSGASYPRVPMVYEMMYETVGKNEPGDVFVTANNGFTYTYVNYLLDAEGKDYRGFFDNYKNAVKRATETFDVDVLGCYFGSWLPLMPDEPGTTQTIFNMFSEYFPYGVFIGQNKYYYYEYNNTIIQAQDPFTGQEMYYQNGNGAFNINTVVTKSLKKGAGRPTFQGIRVILVSPTQVYNFSQQLLEYDEYEFEIVDCYTYFKLYKDYMDECKKGDDGMYGANKLSVQSWVNV